MKVLTAREWGKLCAKHGTKAMNLHSDDVYDNIKYREHFVILSLGTDHQHYNIVRYIEALEIYVKNLHAKRNTQRK